MSRELVLQSLPVAVVDLDQPVALELGELAPGPLLAEEFQLGLEVGHMDTADAADTVDPAACMVDWDSVAFALADILAQDTVNSPSEAAH